MAEQNVLMSITLSFNKTTHALRLTDFYKIPLITVLIIIPCGGRKRLTLQEIIFNYEQ